MRQEAGRLAKSGKPAEATELLIQALALWRGPAALGTRRR
ncbi:BTAD domain-containing putative transcriptional regulator [Streptomyces chartreusis]